MTRDAHPDPDATTTTIDELEAGGLAREPYVEVGWAVDRRGSPDPRTAGAMGEAADRRR